ncbi:MAG: MFS transporter [Candidatus Eiseniibacteriota bacterium]
MSDGSRGMFAGITRNVAALGVVSLLTDISSEMIIPVLPIFVTVTLGASMASLGMIEGVAESTASILRIASGWLSDRVGQRKPFIVFGYSTSVVAKVGLVSAKAWPAVLGLRFIERVGKGLRSPPRDALLADSSDQAHRGRAFGFHRSMDTLGAAMGPLAAFALLSQRPDDFRRVFAIAIVPAVLSVLVLILWVRAPRHTPVAARSLSGEWRGLGGPLRRFLLADAVFQLGNSSMAFVLLRTRDVGFSAGAVTLIYFGYNVVFALLAFPLGGLSDRLGRRPLILGGYLLYALVYGLLGATHSRMGAVAAFMLMGLHSALIEGQQRSLVADLVPAERRATAFGAYYTVVGLALLPASVIAGLLWERCGAGVTFAVDSALALAAAASFTVLLPLGAEQRDRRAP